MFETGDRVIGVVLTIRGKQQVRGTYRRAGFGGTHIESILEYHEPKIWFTSIHKELDHGQRLIWPDPSEVTDAV